MSNSKISALTSATTPLAGTETLPIVQSSTTKQVSVANLTAGRAVSATSFAGNVLYTTALAGSPASTTQNLYIYSSSGLNANAGIEWQYSASGSGYGFKMNVNGGTDTLDIGYRANSATWTKTFGFGNDGNLVPFVAAKGINFTANTPASGMTSQLLNWYEQGTFTPTVTSGTGTLGSVTASGAYTRVGNQVTISAYIKITLNGTGGAYLKVAGLPFTIGSNGASGAVYESAVTGNTCIIQGPNGGTIFYMYTYNNGYPGGTNAQFNLSFTYLV